MGFLSLSFLVGDGFSRLYLSLFVFLKFNWQQLFFVSGITTCFSGLLSFLFIKNSPKGIKNFYFRCWFTRT
jgi:sugar phosphate permease